MSQKKPQRIPNFTLGHQRQIPSGLRDLKRWINWILFARDGAATKTPYSCEYRCLMSVQDESKFVDFDTATRYCNRQYAIGFVLGDGICGLDLDNCYNSKTNTIEPWALRILRMFDTYTEISPSGTGLKLFFRGQIPRDANGKTKNRRAMIIDGESRGEFEVYDRDRVFTVTGDRMGGVSREIEDRQDILNQFHEFYFGKPETWSAARKRAENGTKCPLAEKELIEKIKASRSGEKFTKLMDGDVSEYQGDYSRADFALMAIIAFWAGPDPDRIISIWLDSKLCDGREEKVNRTYYQDRTCERVLDSMEQYYNWHQPAPIRLPVRPNANNFIKHQREIITEKITDVSTLEIGTPENTPNEGDQLRGESEPTDEKTELPQPIRNWSLPNDLPQAHHQYARTDLGRAEMLIDRWGDRILYCSVRGWLYWDGAKWVEDAGGATVKNLAEETIRSGLSDEALALVPDVPPGATVAANATTGGNATTNTPTGGNGTQRVRSRRQPTQRDLWQDYCRKSENQSYIENTLKSAQRKLVCSPSDFDQDPYLLNCANGLVDLRSGEIQPHNPSQRLMQVCPHVYDPEAQCPEFLSFLSMIFPEDPDTVRYVQELAGYCCTGTMTERTLPLWWGSGANGKGVLSHLLEYVLGTDYAGSAPNSLLMEKPSNVDFDIAELAGKRLLICDETDNADILRCGLVKRLTSNNGKLRGAKKHQNQFEFYNTAKLLILTNSRPRVPDNTNAIWDRLAPLEFKVSFYNPQNGEIGDHIKDPQLQHRLEQTEAVGILAWIVEGAKRMLAQREIRQSETVIGTRGSYRRDQDVLRAFLDDVGCLGVPRMDEDEAIDRGFYMQFKKLFELYKSWDGASHKRTGFQELILSHGYKIIPQKKIDGQNIKGCIIGIKPPPDVPITLNKDHYLYEDRTRWGYGTTLDN